jgi:predicted amidohydrolase
LTPEPIQRLARRFGTAVAAGYPEKNPRSRRPLNALALAGPDGRLVAKFHKLHLFTVGKSPESSAYSAGSGPVVCRYRGWKIGFAICFDLRFPSLFHAYAKAGVDLMLVPSCWIGGPYKSEQYRTLGSAYANLTQAFLAAVNRSGKDPFFEYDGSSYVFSPFGDDRYARRACGLDATLIDACRKMRVRSADRPSYKLR